MPDAAIGRTYGTSYSIALHPSSEKLYGVDITPTFFDPGYELYCDKDTLHPTFLVVHLLKPAKEIPATSR